MDVINTYHNLRDSRQEWLGMIPNEWKLSRIGSLYTLRNTKVSDKDYPPLSVTMKGIVPQLETAAKTDDGDNRKLVKVGDFAINSRSDRRGSCGISPYDGSVSLINTVLTPKDEMHPGYYNWLFHTVAFADEFYKWGHGIVNDLWTTRWQEMKRIVVPVPSLSVQESISIFLDERCKKIDDSIDEMRRSTEEYKQWKAAIIEETVTQGLTPNVIMRNSGVEWVEEIPHQWEVSRLKTLFSFGKGLPITKDNLVDEGVPVISYGQIHAKFNTGTSITDDLLRYVPETYLDTNADSLVSKGDILVADTSEDKVGCGNCVYVDRNMKLFAGYHTIILKSKSGNNNKFLAYLFKSNAWRSQIRTRVSGVKLFSVSKKILNDVSVILPPEVEQEEIVAYLDEKCSLIDEIISEKNKMIFDLEMYKRSLIYEVVTGKRKVV